MARERKIKGTVYRCEKIPAAQGIELYCEMNEVFEGDAAIGASLVGNPDEKAILATFAIAPMRTKLDGTKVRDFLHKLVGMCFVSGEQCIPGIKPADFEETVLVAWFCLETQFRDFLAASLPQARAGAN